VSFRYQAAINKPGFNPLGTQTSVSGVQYSGLWNLSSQANAQGAGTWPTPPIPRNLYSWGENLYGQLGLGNRTYYSSPKQVGSLTDWAVVSSGISGFHNIAVKSDGTLWAWGRGATGRLGLNLGAYGTASYSSPKQVGSLTSWLTVSAGYDFSLAVKTNGTLWSWGNAASGQLGLGNQSTKSSPNQIGALTDWLSVAAGYFWSLATKTDGTLWAWGGNGQGQLGLNISYAQSRSSPVQVGSLTTWSKIKCTAGSSFAIKTDGTLWSWGSNSDGNLGLGNTTDYSSPVQVGSLTTWSILGTGRSFAGAIKTDGTLWTWGQNPYGQLGDGTRVKKSSPVQIGALTNWLALAGGYASFTSVKRMAHFGLGDTII